MILKVMTALCALAVCCYAGFLLVADFDRNDVGRGNRIGKPLYHAFDAQAVETIRISKGDDALVLKRDGRVWRVASQLDYPADAMKIKELFDVLGRIKVLNSHEMSDDDLVTLGLGNPVEKEQSTGCLLEFLSGDGSTMAALVVGDEHKGIHDRHVSDGRFVRLLGENTACVVPYLFPEAEVDGSLWLDRSFPSSKQTRRITIRENDSVIWGFVRDDMSKNMYMTNLPAGESLDYDAVSRLEHAVEFARFSCVASAEQKEQMTFGSRIFEFETFDDFVYSWVLADALVDGRLPVKVTVSLATGVKSTKKLNDQLRCEQAHYEGWIYLLPRSTFAPLQMSPKAFLKVTRQ